jgi:hypothetical protein
MMSGLDLILGFAGIVGIVLAAMALIEIFGGAVTSLGWWVRERVQLALGQRTK